MVTNPGILPPDLSNTDDGTDVAGFTNAYVTSVINKLRKFAL